MSINVNIDNIQIDPTRKEILKDEFQKKYFLEIKKKLIEEKND
jgi:hypothetical protein